MTATTPSGSNWVVVDSPGWIAYLADGEKADAFAPYLEATGDLLVPSIIVYEVYNKLCREQGKSTGAMFLSQAFAFGSRLIPLNAALSIQAAHTNLEIPLPTVQAIIYATAQAYQAQLVTSDAHFANLPGVTVI